jgi:hypothetical protein
MSEQQDQRIARFEQVHEEVLELKRQLEEALAREKRARYEAGLRALTEVEQRARDEVELRARIEVEDRARYEAR